MSEVLLLEWWRPIPGTIDYEASSAGRIRHVGGSALRERTIKGGYRTVQVTTPEGRQDRVVSRLVALAFHGEPERAMQAAHQDGRVSNNRPSNLRWRTARDNNREKIGHGTIANGERIGTSKLNADQVRAIRASRTSLSAAAAEYGVTLRTISLIRRRQTWRHV